MGDQNEQWAETVARLLALAQRLEGHGQYNLVKLARAAADALGRRAAYRLNLADDVAENAADLLALSALLPGFGLGQEWPRLLARGAEAMRANRLPLIDEIPNPYVCRTCGEIAPAKPDSPCPVCGAWPTTFQQFLPVYWLNELEPAEALAQLHATPVIVKALVAGLPEDRLDEPGTGGGWSMRHVIAHMRDAEGVLSFRVRRMMEQENPTLESLAVFEWASRQEERPPRTADILQTYLDSRDDTVSFLAGLRAEEWQRVGQHTEFGQVTIRQQASYFSAHEQTHLTSLASMRRTLLE